jgi:hypothetical protein
MMPLSLMHVFSSLLLSLTPRLLASKRAVSRFPMPQPDIGEMWSCTRGSELLQIIEAHSLVLVVAVVVSSWVCHVVALTTGWAVSAKTYIVCVVRPE